MTYPIHPKKSELAPILHARSMLAARGLSSLLERHPAPETFLFCMHPGMMRNFMLRHPSRRIQGFPGDIFIPNKFGGRVGVSANFGIGAPVAVLLAEELIAWGCRRIVVLGSAGGLQPGMRSGDIVLGDRAIRDEGTSYHYLPAGKYVPGTPGLISALSTTLANRDLEHQIGTIWSTDAPYRESREEAIQYRGEGVLAVDMESAGLYAMGQVRGVETASVLVLGDHLSPDGWSLSEDLHSLHRTLARLFDILTGMEFPGER
jgi:uridine phosphorylase